MSKTFRTKYPSKKAVFSSISPETAVALLEKNFGRNRPISKAGVEVLSQSIQDNDWFSESGAIHFDVNGNLINGQHRLTAIANSGKTVEMLCVFGSSAEAMRHIDQGKARNVAQVLHMAGVPNARPMAALALMLERLEKRSICHLPLSAHRVQMLLDRYEKEIPLVCVPAVIDPGIKSGGVAVRSALVFSMKHLPHKPILRMIEQIVNGDCQKGDPAYAVRKHIATNSTIGEHNRYYMACKVIAAAEAQAHGRQVLSLCESIVKAALERITA